MKTSATLYTSPPASPPTSMTSSMLPPAIMQQRSPWHSPVPYLFGGLAAMLGLIAFALLILACSYWKLSGSQVDNNNGENGDDGDHHERDLENGGGDEKTGDGGNNGKGKFVYEEKIVVIMAGNVNPTFLATPMANYKAASFGGDCIGKGENKEQGDKTDKSEKEKHLEQQQSTTTTTMEEEEEEEEQSQEERETQVAHVMIHEQTQ